MRYLLLLLALTACTPVIQTEYVTQPLTHDPRPVLPKISAQELQCLSDETYQKLFDRQRLVVEYASSLEAILDSTK
jgi:hypothetical protein